MLKLTKGHKVINEYYYEDPINFVKGYFMVDVTEKYEELSRFLPKHFLNKGHFSGYVALTKGHKDYGKNRNNIGVEVHGGITLSQEIEYQNEKYWIVGFHTAHADDTSEYWNQERTLNETKKLYQQMVFRGIE